MSIYRRFEKAQALVEFTLTMALLLMLVLGILEVGRLLFYVSAITSAAREGARYGSAAGGIGGEIDKYDDCPGIRAAAARIGQYAGVREWGVTIGYEISNDGDYWGCPSSAALPLDTSIGLGDRVIVIVEGKFEPFVGMVNLPPYQFSSTARRTIVKGVEVR